jgi:dUTP pyrophosphatase
MTSILYWRPEGTPDLARATTGASGYDLAARLEVPTYVRPGGRAYIPCGVHLAMPIGVEAQVRRRSGLARNRGVITDVGTIDADFRGEIGVVVFNFGDTTLAVMPGDRVAQLVFAPVILADDPDWTLVLPAELVRVAKLEDLPDSARGAGGWGSTGVPS